MDLITLIAACALSVDPNVMHALVFEQSGGEPWSFPVPSESVPRVLPTIEDAVRAARSAGPDGGRIRVGLTGLSTGSWSVSAITLAARRLTQLMQRCKTASKPDSTYCAIAAYRGSWEQPDTRFADMVRAAVEKGNAPNFDMPKDAYFEASDIASAIQATGPQAAPTSPDSRLDDRMRGSSSALFPARPSRPDSPSTDLKNDERPTEQARVAGRAAEAPATSKSLIDSLFVPRSSERAP